MYADQRKECKKYRKINFHDYSKENKTRLTKFQSALRKDLNLSLSTVTVKWKIEDHQIS